MIERAVSFVTPYGRSTIQLIRGETDSPTRLWEDIPQSWWSIPKHSAYAGMAERIYEKMVQEEEHCALSYGGHRLGEIEGSLK